MTAKRVFYSWQSSIGDRFTVENRVKKAIGLIEREMKEDVLVEGRPTELVLQTGVSNEPGTPEIFSTIKKRIKACDVYIADITPFEHGDRYYINPNAAIELGFALALKPSEKIILIASSLQIGEPVDSKWPFDIRHSSLPWCFGKMQTEEKNVFDLNLAARIKASLAFEASSESEYVRKLSPEKNLPFKAGSVAHNRYFTSGANNSTPVWFFSRNHLFLHLWPIHQPKERSLLEIREQVEKMNLHLVPARDWSYTSLSGDCINFCHDGWSEQAPETFEVFGGTGVFRTGETFIFKNLRHGANLREIIRVLKGAVMLHRNCFGGPIKMQAGIAALQGERIVFDVGRGDLLGASFASGQPILTREFVHQPNEKLPKGLLLDLVEAAGINEPNAERYLFGTD